MNVSVPVSPAGVGAREAATPGQIFTALWRGRRAIVACGLVLALLAYGGAKLLPYQYTAEGLVAVETQRFMIPELQGALSGETAPDLLQVRTEMQVLSSGVLLPAVVEELHLTDDPEYNPDLRAPGALDGLWAAALGLFSKSGAPDGDLAVPQADEATAVAAREVLRQLKITNDNRSLVIIVSLTASNPDTAAAVVNALVRRYIESRADARARANREANTALLQRTDEIRGELRDIERRLQETRVRNSFVSVRAGSVGQQQLEELTSALTRTSAERAQLEASWQRAVAITRAGGVPIEHADVLHSQTIIRLRDREAEATRKVAEVSDRLGPRHPDRRAAEAELAALRGQIAAEAQRITASLESQVRSAREREAEIQRQLDNVGEGATRVAAIQAEIAQLEKDAETRRVLLQTLLARAEQTSAEPQGTAQLPGARIVAFAESPERPSSPRPKLAGAIGLVAGFAFGGLLAVVRGNGRSGVVLKAPEIIETTGLPVLATMPRIQGRRGRKALSARVTAMSAGSAAEALRILRARLRYAGRAGAPRSVVFVSSVAGEGASSLAAAFARTAAQDGLRTLLLEGDLESPSLARLLDQAEGEGGLIRTLEGSVSWREVVVRNTAPLDLLLAGQPGLRPHHLLEGMRFQNLLTEAAEEYNLIVMDAPPITLGSGALPLTDRADAVVLVVGAGIARRGSLQEAMERLAAASRGPIAVVLNENA